MYYNFAVKNGTSKQIVKTLLQGGVFCGIIVV